MQNQLLIVKVTALFLWIFITGCSDKQNISSVGVERFGEVNHLLKNYVDQGFISGANALVIQNGKIIYRDHVGWMDVDTKKSMTENTLFRIASMTKAMTTVAVMMLKEEGLINLYDPVSKFIPAFSDPVVVVDWKTSNDPITAVTKPAIREITIHDLLTHTSGLSYTFTGGENFSKLYMDAGISDGLVQTNATLEQNIERLALLPLMHQPGTTWHYGLSTDVLGRVIEVASGVPLNTFFRDRIFEPLELNDTRFYLPESSKKYLATLYTLNSEGNIIPAGEKPIQRDNMSYSSSYHYVGPQKYYSGGAGLVSTISDYAQFLQMLLNEGEVDGIRLLKRESVQLMTVNQIGSLSFPDFVEHGDTFGYGFAVVSEEGGANDVASPGSYSWGGLFNTYYWIDPQKDLLGVLMTQVYPYSHLTLRQDFKEAVYEVLREELLPVSRIE